MASAVAEGHRGLGHCCKRCGGVDCSGEMYLTEGFLVANGLRLEGNCYYANLVGHSFRNVNLRVEL